MAESAISQAIQKSSKPDTLIDQLELAAKVMDFQQCFPKDGNAPTELQFFDATLAQDGKQKVKVKIRRLEGVVEIYLNEHRMLLAPAHDGFDDVAINLKAVGIRARFESWSVVELVSKSKSEKSP